MVAQLKAVPPAVVPAPQPPPRARLGRIVAVVVGLVAPAALLVFNMVRAAPLTIDDSYISFRYARNLVQGLGLVYNAGERVEGYTNFLWTVLLAGGIRLGVDPALTAKLLGGAAALGTLMVVWRLSQRLLPVKWLPPLATWLLASSMPFSGYAVLGLETALFCFLVALGLLLLAREADDERRFPWSGVVYALAGLTRPEAPLYFGLAMLFLVPRPLGRRNRVRVILFAAIIGAHLVWRHHYYGSWLPNTFSAKTGALGAQLAVGRDYLGNWIDRAGAIFWFALAGAALAFARPSRLGLAVVATAVAVGGYVVLVGGDWMPEFRFLVPFELFAFLLVDVGVRAAARGRRRPLLVALALFVAGSGYQRVRVMNEQSNDLATTKWYWDGSVGEVSKWLKQHGHPGTVAMGDIGFVGWDTGYPILDILGLVDPVIAKLPGGYTNKQGPRYLDYFFARMPEYFILISNHDDCAHPMHPAISAVYRDPQNRFRGNYRVAQRIVVGGEYNWCIYQHAPPPVERNRRLLFDFEGDYRDWSRTGNAFAQGPTPVNVSTQQLITGAVGRAVANSFHPERADAPTGTLTSPPFAIDRDRMALLVGGGARPTTRVELVADGKVVHRASGVDSEDLQRVVWDVRALRGKRAQIRLVDEETGTWGHVVADEIALFDPAP